MTKEEIIELAINLGAEEMKYVTDMEGPTISIKFRLENDSLEKFAKLIAEKEREHLIQIGLIGVLKHCEDLLREDGHEDAMNDVQEMISKIRARGKND